MGSIGASPLQDDKKICKKKNTRKHESSYKTSDGDCFTPTGFAMTTFVQLRARQKKESRFPSRFLKFNFFLEASRNKRPCKNLQGFKVRNFFSCEQSKAADPKPYKSYGERSRTPLCEANGKITCQSRPRRPGGLCLPAVRAKRHHP